MSDRIGYVKVIEKVATFTGQNPSGFFDRCVITVSGDSFAVRDSVRKLGLNTEAIQYHENVVMEMTMGDALFKIGELLKNGEKINAIKLVRQLTGMGLKESKDIIDAFISYGKRTETFTVR